MIAGHFSKCVRICCELELVGIVDTLPVLILIIAISHPKIESRLLPRYEVNSSSVSEACS